MMSTILPTIFLFTVLFPLISIRSSYSRFACGSR
jgi:hypothetical protein